MGVGGSLKSRMHAVLYVQKEKLNNGGESTVDALEGRRSIDVIFPRRSALGIKIFRSGEKIYLKNYALTKYWFGF